jgi:hypothetical protein
MPAATRLTQALALAAGLLFAAFVAEKGVPSLRHDWNWPVDRTAIGSFFSESVDGWVPIGFGLPNPHPTTYLIGPPLAAVMWIAGPLAALVLLAALTGYACARGGGRLAERFGKHPAASAGIALFAIFNPWVYNQVVAGHLVMVLAYGGILGMLAEMSRARDASPVRLALWMALVEAQLQLFIVAACALAVFALTTKKWQPLVAGAIVALPSIVGIVADRGALLHIPYGVEWQRNQSVAPLALAGLGGYFPGYADRLGVAAAASCWIVLGLALAGAAAARRSRTALAVLAAAAVLYLAILGSRGPLAIPYESLVRHVPESGVFRELYDLAGPFAALAALLAAVAASRVRGLAYVAFAAGIVLPVTWVLHPPAGFWVGGASYPHPAVGAPAYSRVAFSPAFQPLQLRAGGGDGADPDAHGYPGAVATLNTYFPSYPVDAALARYERFGDANALSALGVTQIVNRPWLSSRTQGAVGLAASSLAVRERPQGSTAVQRLGGATPLVSACDRTPIVTAPGTLRACDVFFGDAFGYATVRPIDGAADSIDPRTAWIDARLAFARAPELAQGIGGALTQSRVPQTVEPRSWLLAWVRGELDASGGRTLRRSGGTFAWIRIPPDVDTVTCDGLCELVAQTTTLPSVATRAGGASRALAFAPWLYVAGATTDSARAVRLDERYDPAWIAIARWHMLPHVRIGASANGWYVEQALPRVILVHVTSLVQLIAEALGVLCVLYLLKALAREPTKRAP